MTKDTIRPAGLVVIVAITAFSGFVSLAIAGLALVLAPAGAASPSERFFVSKVDKEP